MTTFIVFPEALPHAQTNLHRQHQNRQPVQDKHKICFAYCHAVCVKYDFPEFSHRAGFSLFRFLNGANYERFNLFLHGFGNIPVYLFVSDSAKIRH
jgi:hypothetical protein